MVKSGSQAPAANRAALPEPRCQKMEHLWNIDTAPVPNLAHFMQIFPTAYDYCCQSCGAGDRTFSSASPETNILVRSLSGGPKLP